MIVATMPVQVGAHGSPLRVLHVLHGDEVVIRVLLQPNAVSGVLCDSAPLREIALLLLSTEPDVPGSGLSFVCFMSFMVMKL